MEEIFRDVVNIVWAVDNLSTVDIAPEMDTLSMGDIAWAKDNLSTEEIVWEMDNQYMCDIFL